MAKAQWSQTGLATRAPDPGTPADYDRRFKAMMKRKHPADRLAPDRVLTPGEFLLVRRDKDNLIGQVLHADSAGNCTVHWMNSSDGRCSRTKRWGHVYDDERAMTGEVYGYDKRHGRDVAWDAVQRSEMIAVFRWPSMASCEWAMV